MNRLYSVESTPTSTGAMADHRLRLRASDIEGFARALARELGLNSVAAPAAAPQAPAEWIPALARDLKQHSGASLVVAGDQQPPVVHAIVHAINQALGNFDKTVYFTEPIEQSPSNQWSSMGELAADIRAGSVSTLLILGGNPAYDAPADLGFKELLPKVPFSARLGQYEDETSALCHWHIPEAHELESWGDARAYDGTVSVIQPLIAPLYGGKIRIRTPGPAERESEPSRRTISCTIIGRRKRPTKPHFDAFWEKTLRDGVVAGTAFPPKQVSLKPGIGAEPPAAPAQGLEIVFRPDPTIYDGRFCKQRLAAGIAQASDQAHLGRRGHGEPENGGAPGSEKRASRRTQISGPHDCRAGLGHARPRR